MHAVWGGISYQEPAPPTGHQLLPPPPATMPTPTFAVRSPDTPIVAIDTPSPIVFLRDEQIAGDSWHFNLFNNAWNTNYPLWEINTDERFRFSVFV